MTIVWEIATGKTIARLLDRGRTTKDPARLIGFRLYHRGVAYREPAKVEALPPLVLRPRMNRVLIAVAIAFLLGPLALQATLWSSVVVVRCVREPKSREIECGVTRDAWLSHEAHLVNVSDAVGFVPKGALYSRGDAWVDLEGRDKTVMLTPKLNVAKGDIMTSTRELNEWLMRGDDGQLEIRTSYGSPWGAFYVPILSSILGILVAVLVTGRVRLRGVGGGRIVVDCSRSLGPRAPMELALDDVRCFSLDGPKLVLVTKKGDVLLARTVMAARAEEIIARADAWLEEARSGRATGS